MKAWAALAVLLVTGCASGRTDGAAPRGYLSDDAMARLVAGVPAPATGSEPLADPPSDNRRWLALAHAELRPPEAAQHFDCVLGVRWATAPRPGLTRMMRRLFDDADRLSRILADAHPRPRPSEAVEGLEPCQRVGASPALARSWPASGAVVSAAYGEMFRDLAPDRSDAIRRIADEMGASRALCRMNWPSDVADGLAIGRGLYAEVSAAPDFRADLDAARADLVAARAEGLTNPGCAAERRALGDRGGALRPGAG